MSDRPPPQGLPHERTREGSYPQRGPQAQATSTPLERHAQPSASAGPSPAMQRQSYGHGRPFELPPLPQAPSGTGGSFSPSAIRPVGMPPLLSSIQTDESQQSRRRKAGELESPGTMHSLPPLMHAHSRPQGLGHPPSYGPGPDAMGRPRLTPRSPLHRAASLSQLNQPTATRDAQRSPFLASPRARTYMIEPGTAGAPPLPTPPAGMRPSYAFPTAAQASQQHQQGPRRISQPAQNTSGAPSSSASPGSEYQSEYSREQTSPHEQYASAGPSGSGDQRFGIPISSSSGQNVYQMMTLETTSGTVQLPVDVQAASRVSDEKRKRNAGASARFRQRRKEKEKEASTTIAKLEQQVKEAAEDAEFYKRERDYLAGVVLQVPGGDRHFPRPPSPRRHQRRSSNYTSSSARLPEYPPVQEQVGRGPAEGERNVRRRTSTYALQPLPPPGSIVAQSPTTQPPFGGQNIYGGPGVPQQQPQQPQLHPREPQQAQPSLQQPPPSLQALGGIPGPPGGRLSLPSPAALTGGMQLQPQTQQQQPQQQQHGQPPPPPPQLLQAQPQTGPWNPYASDRRPQLPPPDHPRDPREGR